MIQATTEKYMLYETKIQNTDAHSKTQREKQILNNLNKHKSTKMNHVH